MRPRVRAWLALLALIMLTGAAAGTSIATSPAASPQVTLRAAAEKTLAARSFFAVVARAPFFLRDVQKSATERIIYNAPDRFMGAACPPEDRRADARVGDRSWVYGPGGWLASDQPSPNIKLAQDLLEDLANTSGGVTRRGHEFGFYWGKSTIGGSGFAIVKGGFVVQAAGVIRVRSNGEVVTEEGWFVPTARERVVQKEDRPAPPDWLLSRPCPVSLGG